MAIWGSGAGDVYIASATTDTSVGRIYHGQLGSWATQLSVQGPIAALWGSGPADVYAGGPTGILHSTGNGTWVQENVSPSGAGATGAVVNALGGSGPSDVYAGTNAGLFHSRGDGSWALVDSCIGAQYIWGSSASDVFLDELSTNWMLLHNGTVELTMDGRLPGNGFAGIWGSGPGDVYVVGDENYCGSLIRHRDQFGNWSAEYADYNDMLSAVWGTTTDVYAGGVHVILHRKR